MSSFNRYSIIILIRFSLDFMILLGMITELYSILHLFLFFFVCQGMAQFVTKFAEPGEPEYSPPVPVVETPVMSILLRPILRCYMRSVIILFGFLHMEFLWRFDLI